MTVDGLLALAGVAAGAVWAFPELRRLTRGCTALGHADQRDPAGGRSQ